MGLSGEQEPISMNLEACVIEWLAGERLGQDRHLMVESIMRIAKHSDGAWPIAERYQWNKAVDACLAAGTVVIRSGKLAKAPKTQELASNSETQLDLF